MQTNVKKTLTFALSVILAAAVLWYAYFRARDFLRGPILTVDQPENGITLISPLTEISGTARNISFLSLDGRTIFTDKNGNWNEKQLLSDGYNIIEIDAKDRFGREIKKTLQLVLKEKTSVGTSTPTQ